MIYLYRRADPEYNPFNEENLWGSDVEHISFSRRWITQLQWFFSMGCHQSVIEDVRGGLRIHLEMKTK